MEAFLFLTSSWSLCSDKKKRDTHVSVRYWQPARSEAHQKKSLKVKKTDKEKKKNGHRIGKHSRTENNNRSMVPFSIWRRPSQSEALTCISSMWRSMLCRVRVCNLWSDPSSNLKLEGESGTCAAAAAVAAAAAASSSIFSSWASFSRAAPPTALRRQHHPSDIGEVSRHWKMITQLLIWVVYPTWINSTAVYPLGRSLLKPIPRWREEPVLWFADQLRQGEESRVTIYQCWEDYCYYYYVLWGVQQYINKLLLTFLCNCLQLQVTPSNM